MDATPMIIDRQMPAYDVTIAEHMIVTADPAATLMAAKKLDFMSIHTPLLSAAMWTRGLPDRLRNREVEPPPRLVLGEGDGLPGWVILGESDTEIAFGAVGRFWKSSIDWRDVEPDRFLEFNEPGWGKIACNFSVRRYGEIRTLLTYECRTATTDEIARRRFAHYWFAIKPFVGHIMRATVHTIAVEAEQATHAAVAREPSTAGPGR